MPYKDPSNPKRKAYEKKWYTENKERVLAKGKITQKLWIKNNHAKHLARRRIWTRTPAGIVASLRGRLRREGKSLLFTNIEFVDWYKKQDEKCFYCGITKDLFNGYWKNFSIDRKNNEQGYFLDNIVLACFRCNTIKNNFFTVTEMKEIAEKYIKPKLGIG